MKRMLIDVDTNLFRLCLIENGEPIEFYVETKKQESIVGNIYIGRVVNVIPNLQAAFLDIGEEKNAYWYYGNQRATSDEIKQNRPKVGEEFVVQVEKDAVGTKGAVLTRNISFAGKFLVLLPEESGEIRISRKITQEQERNRIRTMIQQTIPQQYGVIVRTNGEQKTNAAFEMELQHLIAKWEAVKKAQYQKAPALIWQEETNIQKAVRDCYTADLDSVVVNDAAVYELLKNSGDFGEEGQPELLLHTEQIPLFASYYVESKLEKACVPKVWLPNGGYLVIEETEACVVIDVNSAKSAGRGDLETMIYKTNIEAAKEVAKQLRLRNLSGIIIIDFIDMVQQEHQKSLQKILEQEVAKDRMKVHVVGMTQLGLMQLTRKKIKPSLQKQITTKCRSCEGTGMVFTIDWTVSKMRRETQQLCTVAHTESITVCADERLLCAYCGEHAEFIQRIKQQYDITIRCQPKSSTNFGWYELIRTAVHHVK